MASRFMKLFFNPEGVAAANAKFKARLAEIDEKNETVTAAIVDARARNKAAFKEQLKENNRTFKEAWSK